MKFLIVIPILLSRSETFAQGTFVYDQQSSDEAHVMEGGYGFGQQPLGQSFTPTLDTVGFIRLALQGGFGSGSFYINLRSDSITGSILGTTASVSSTGSGIVDFLFNTPVSVTTGTTYYFQPVIEGGNGWGLNAALSYNYGGGTAFVNGARHLP